MKKEPLVSVIIPTYNRAHLIGEMLDSILAQTYHNWECIIVDDGSSDNTDEIVNEYVKKDSRFKYFHRPDEHLPGGNGARNYGFKMSQGEYIQWFDSDDLMVAEKLELCINEIYKDDFDIVVTNFEDSNGKKNEIDLTNFRNPLEYHLAYGTLNTVMVFFKRSYLKNLTFNEKLCRAQEYEFYTRSLNKQTRYSIVNEITVIVRIHDLSINSIHKKKGLRKQNLSMLFTKLQAYKKSFQFDKKCQKLAKYKFIKSLWAVSDRGEADVFIKYLIKYFSIGKTRKYRLTNILVYYIIFLVTGKMRYNLKSKLFNT